MMAAHYAAGLVAHQRVPRGCLLFYLIVSQLLDLLWIVFHFLGLEHTEPRHVWDTSLTRLDVQMIYSHDLLPVIGWCFVVFALGWWLFSDRRVGIAAAVLVAVHAATDYVAGFPHNVFGPGSPAVGTGLYYTNVFAAIAFEAVFASVALWLYFGTDAANGRPWTRAGMLAMSGLFAFGVVFLLSVADRSLRDVLGFKPIDFPVATGVPILAVIYSAMIAWAIWAERRFRPVARGAGAS